MEGFANFFMACANVFTLQGLLWLTFATALGMVVGALPGLSATLGIALLSGLTFTMETNQAITVLMGVYVGAIYGGSITAILINVPGTGSAAATALDGYPLAKKGFAGSAIRVTRTASMIGTFIGMFALMLIAPLLTSLALQFTSPEFFLLSVFGILICGNITSKDITIKGWISGIIGILVSLVGIDNINGVHRFTFDIPNLQGGINLVPAMIGFFAFPQIIKALRGGGEKATADLNSVSADDKKVSSLSECIKHIGLVARSSLIGIGVGALPGVGENVAAWLAYGHAKNTSKQPEKFGTGVYEAVIAPETANNAAIGGALIPMLTLAVPGSPPAAVMLGALTLHGLRPGPRLTVNNPLFIYEVCAMLLGATVLLWIIGVLVSKPMEKIVMIPDGLLMPVVAVLCIIGAYSLNLSRFDLACMFIFGVFGYALDSMGYSAAAIILGVILGRMLDENFRRMLVAGGGSASAMFTRPIALIFLIATLWTILGPMFSKKLKNKQKEISENVGE